MSSEIAKSLQFICDEKGLKYEEVLDALQSALAAAYRKDFGNRQQNIQCIFDPETGDMKMWDEKEVVEDIDEEKLEKDQEELGRRREEAHKQDRELTEEEMEDLVRFNPKTQIMLTEAKEHSKKIKVGDILKINLEVPGDFGRMAAQTAKQVIIQRLREAEREVVFSEYKEKEGQVIPATVQRVEGRTVFVNIGHTVAVMPYSEQVAREHYTPGQRLRVFLVAVNAAAKGPEVLVSRAHPEIVRQLFTLEVPEIASGAVAIKAISREAGSRTKIAVAAKDANIDPIGSCVGQRGTRVQTVINELGGEKIDIIAWSEDISKFITAALAPAKVQNVTLNEEEKSAKVEVSDDQLSLAIGRGGQNVRLAVKLTGWKIDIVGAGGQPIPADSEAPAAEGEIAPVSAEAKPPAEAAADSVSVDEKTTGASASNTAAEEPTEIPAPAAASNSDEVK